MWQTLWLICGVVVAAAFGTIVCLVDARIGVDTIVLIVKSTSIHTSGLVVGTIGVFIVVVAIARRPNPPQATGVNVASAVGISCCDCVAELSGGIALVRQSLYRWVCHGTVLRRVH